FQCAAGGQRQGDHRRRWRRVRVARFHRRYQCRNRQSRVEDLHDGGSWNTGTYDHATNTLFWGVGNPGPWLATLRPGDNLYTDSVLALNPNNGKIKWYYQWTPNDTWDYDGANETVMTNLTYGGTPYQALVHADRNGWFYALDRTNGKLIYAEPFVHTTSITGMKDGVSQSDPA